MKTPTINKVIKYQPDLVALLKAEHKELTADCDLIFLYINKKNFPDLNKTFKRFASLLQDHWAHERELYMYLEFVVSESDGTYRDTRSEMRAIAASVNSTINLHTNMLISAETLVVFKKNFAIMTKAFIGRMRYEEKYLYKEYEQHSA